MYIYHLLFVGPVFIGGPSIKSQNYVAITCKVLTGKVLLTVTYTCIPAHLYRKVNTS